MPSYEYALWCVAAFCFYPLWKDVENIFSLAGLLKVFAAPGAPISCYEGTPSPGAPLFGFTIALLMVFCVMTMFEFLTMKLFPWPTFNLSIGWLARSLDYRLAFAISS